MVSAELAEAAAASFPGSVPREWRVVGDIVQGHLVDCDGMVRYGAGAKPQKRHFTNEPAFQALMEHIPTGERHLKHALWVCCNGCWRDMIEGQLNFVPDMNANQQPVILSPVILADATEITRYGEPVYDARHDIMGAIAGRSESVQHLLNQLPNSRSRVFVKSAAA